METPSLYDSAGCQRYIERYRKDNAREEYIEKEMKKLREHNNGSINPYDLGHIATINKIKDEAERMFGK